MYPNDHADRQRGSQWKWQVGRNLFVFRSIEDMTPFYHTCKTLSSRSTIVYSLASSPYLGSQSHNIFISIISTFLSLAPYLLNHSFLIARSEGKKWNEKNGLRIFFPYLGMLLSTFPNERKKKKKTKLHASWNTILTLRSIYSHFVYWIKVIFDQLLS